MDYSVPICIFKQKHMFARQHDGPKEKSAPEKGKDGGSKPAESNGKETEKAREK